MRENDGLEMIAQRMRSESCGLAERAVAIKPAGIRSCDASDRAEFGQALGFSQEYPSSCLELLMCSSVAFPLILQCQHRRGFSRNSR